MRQVFVATLLGLCLTALHPAQADPPDFSLCEGLSGAARGLCRAGVAAGCADGSGNAASCSSIENNFFRRTGGAAPWVQSPVCPCDYAASVPITAEAWSDGDGPKQNAFTCAGDQAIFVATSPQPQFPQVTAIRTILGQPICQALPQPPDLGVNFATTEPELAACRQDVIAYGTAFLAAFPAHPVIDLCSPTLP